MATPDPFDWRTFLQRISCDLLADVAVRAMLPGDVVAARWLGYEGASDNEIVVVLETKARRSAFRHPYRSFLGESNGWRNCGGPFIYDLWPCSQVGWFQERNQAWIDAYVHPENNGIKIVWPAGQEPPEPLPLTDEEYLVYGDQQDSCRFRAEYLQTALEISDVGDSAILLLNPKLVSSDGEWEAWLFANWAPGAHRYRSFRELMQGEHDSFTQLRVEVG